MLKSKKIKVVLIIFVLLIVAFFAMGKARDRAINNIKSPGKIITSNPINLKQTRAISVFRSCVGHDYSAFNVEGVEESLRTMKHYIEPTEELFNTKGQIEVYAPFDGEISNIDADETPGFNDRGALIWIAADADADWNFLFFHVDLLDGFSKGTKVKSGELIGYANMTSGAANYDFAIKVFRPLLGPNVIANPFDYMTDEVLGEYKQAGFDLERISYTKEYRDANPCPVKPGTESKHDSFFEGYDSPEDWVKKTSVLR